MGYNNAYMQKFEEAGVGGLYSSSLMERHHFDEAIRLLKDARGNLFAEYDSATFGVLLDQINEYILSTDLGNYFPVSRQLSELLQSDAFNFDVPTHRNLLRGLIMTSTIIV